MPTYEYVCTKCANSLEVVRSFTDPPLTRCPSCRGKLRKVFGSVGVVLKGSGFYRTDSRSGGSAARPAAREPAGKSSTSDAPSVGGSASEGSKGNGAAASDTSSSSTSTPKAEPAKT